MASVTVAIRDNSIHSLYAAPSSKPKRVPVIASGEHGDLCEQAIIFHFLFALMAGLARSTVDCSVARGVRWWTCFPMMHIDRTGSETIQLEVRLVLVIWMPGWETLLAARTME